MTKPKVALQLYTLRDEMQKDFVGTLRAVARLGYPAVQFVGYGGMSAAELNVDYVRMAAQSSNAGSQS